MYYRWWGRNNNFYSVERKYLQAFLLQRTSGLCVSMLNHLEGKKYQNRQGGLHRARTNGDAWIFEEYMLRRLDETLPHTHFSALYLGYSNHTKNSSV